MKDPSPNVVTDVTLERECTCLRCSEGVEVHQNALVELLISGRCEWDTGAVYSEVREVLESSDQSHVRTGEPVDLTKKELETVCEALEAEFERHANEMAESYRESFPRPLRLRPSHHRRTA